MDVTKRKKTAYHPVVFYGSLMVLLALVVFTGLFHELAQDTMNAAKEYINTNFSWFYILTAAIILLFTVYLCLSRVGDIKLGPDHSQPSYGTLTWLSMLFAAGMGIGLMFFGVAEPVMHFMEPPVGEAGTVAAAREAMKLTFFHWGLHAWAIYAIVALVLAYFCFRRGLPLTLRSALYPLIGERIYGPIGHLVDIFAVIGTVIGVATSLGLGVAQINTGLNHLYGVPVGTGIQAIFIVVTMGVASLSVFSGLDKGVRRLSELNMILAVALLLFVLILGPTLFILSTFLQNAGDYLSGIVQKTFNLYAYESSNDWIGNWTVMYWAWWLAWSPFVGSFIARISRGRTIREFILGVMLVPTAFTLLWMTVFGDTALYMIMHEGIESLETIVSQDSSMALFAFLEHFPLSSIISLLAIVMIFVFFITSADSASMVVDMFASAGCDDTPVWQSLFWAGVIALVAIALMYADGLKALQTATIITALPFAAALLAAMWGLMRALQVDATKQELHQSLNLSHPSPRNAGGWQRRLRNLMMFTRRSHVVRFIEEVVSPACEEVAEELRKHGFEVNVVNGEDGRVRFELLYEGKVNFVYEVCPRHVALPAIVQRSPDEEDQENRNYFRAEVHLVEGGQDYDIMGWSREDVICDIIDQYEKHLHFLHLTS